MYLANQLNMSYDSESFTVTQEKIIMAGKFRINLMQGRCLNAQALIPLKTYRQIEKWATKDKKAKSHFFREWILDGFEREMVKRAPVKDAQFKEVTE